MKSVCMYFQVHQPLRLKKYRFFNMGWDRNYLDDFTNRSIMQKIAQCCYLPMNALLLENIKKYDGKFKVSFSITGAAIEQFKMYTPEVLESFRELAKTGCVEFLCETYSHSLSSLTDENEFAKEVALHAKTIKAEFGVKPTVFRNTELIYSDNIAEMVSNLGFKTILAEGAKHILGWKSPDFIYACASDQKVKVLLRNFRLSDDISFRFADQGWGGWPLTVDKFVDSLKQETGDVVNLFMDYETFGEHNSEETGIFEFMKHLPEGIINCDELDFVTPSEAVERYQPVAVFHVPHASSWADEERDVTAWLGNDLQNEAFSKLYALKEKVDAAKDADVDYVWRFMQNSDHFYYMATKWFSDGDVHSYFNPYDSPYDAFINYMNVLSDFESVVEEKSKKKPARKKKAVTA
ncbi:MAG: glycoside hydrolase family 57 protein [Rikenellaceae bacterium]